MERSCADRQRDDQSEEDLFLSYREMLDKNALCNSDSKAHTLVKGEKQGGKTLILKLMQSETRENWFQELLRRSRRVEVKIPKQLVSLEDKYLRRCLELMHMNALKGAPCALSVNLGSLDLEVSSDYGTVRRRNSLDMTSCAIDYPMTFGAKELSLSPRDEEIVGSIMGSNSMMRILRNPLFQRLGGSNLFDNKKDILSDYQGSPARVNSSPSKAGKEYLSLRNQRYRSDNVPRSPISMFRGMSLLTDQCYASSPFPSGSQGMLHFTWDGAIPRFSFTLDDQKEVYVANAWKVEITNEKALDYIYSFHLKATGPKLFDIPDNESDLIGKMRVSTAFSLSSNSRIMETEFVLVGTNENHAREMHALSRNNRRSRKLSKVMDVFKAGHSFKQRRPSLFGGSTSVPEDFSPEKGSGACCDSYLEHKPNLSQNDFVSNLELAAIVVKDHMKDEDHQKEEAGGWGLKFLKKAKTLPQVTSPDVFAPSESCPRNVGNCSTSMDIIVPAGAHGGPSTQDEGPSGLIKRWKSGGNCDCGGWDIGCPLSVFKAKPMREEGWPSSESLGNCKSFDMFREGSLHGPSPLKMVNIRDGLYFVSFQPSSLSAFQCFSIAVAIIHSQCPSLRQKHVQD